MPFHFVAFASPVLFLLVFQANLQRDISFPVQLTPQTQKTFFGGFLLKYTNPRGTPYFYLKKDENGGYPFDMSIHVYEDIALKEGKLTGSILLEMETVNNNIVKNYRNRLSGALVHYLPGLLKGKGVNLRETGVFDADPDWVQYFASSIFTMAILLSSLLFGTLSFTMENRMIDAYRLYTGNPMLIIAGKFTAACIKSLLALLVYLTAVLLLVEDFGLPSYRIILPTLLLMGLGVITGMIVGILNKQIIVSFIFSLVSSVILWIFCGGFGTTSAVLPFLRSLAEAIPVTPALRLILSGFLRGPYNVYDFIYPALCFLLLDCALHILYISRIHLPGRGGDSL